MNTEEQDIDIQEQDSIRIARFRAFYESIMAPKDVVPELYFDRNLSRSEFDAKVLEVGYQVALRKLAVEACNGDTKALDLFLKRCDSYFEEKRVKVKVEDATPALSSLVQPARLPSK